MPLEPQQKQKKNEVQFTLFLRLARSFSASLFPFALERSRARASVCVFLCVREMKA